MPRCPLHNHDTREGLGRILPQDARTGTASRTGKTLLCENCYMKRNAGYALEEMPNQASTV